MHTVFEFCVCMCSLWNLFDMFLVLVYMYIFAFKINILQKLHMSIYRLTYDKRDFLFIYKCDMYVYVCVSVGVCM